MVLVFDFDGTIVDSLPYLMDMAKKVAADFHLKPVSLNTARRIGVRGLINHYHASPAQIAKIVLWGHREFPKYLPTLKLIPNLAPILKSLSQSHSLGIMSSNSKANITQFLVSHQLSQYFSFVDCSPDIFGKHHKLLKLRRRLTAIDFYIGDETRDVQAAKKAGVKSIAVTWGFEHPDLLKTAHPDFLINKPSELQKIVFLS